MKVLLILVLIIVAVVLFALFGPNTGKTNTQQSQPKVTTTPQQQQPTAQTARPAPRQGGGGGSLGAAAAGIATDVGDVVNYGIGATQLEAKKRSQAKIKNLNTSHNKTINERLSK